MKRFVFAAALLLGGLFLTTSSASAQSVGIGVHIGNGRSGVSIGVHSGNRGYDHRGHGDWGRRGPVWGGGPVYRGPVYRGPVYRGPVYRDDCGRCDDRDYGYRQPRTIEVTVYETVMVREYDRYGRVYSVERSIPVRHTAYWDDFRGEYYYVDSYGQRCYVR